MCFKCSGFGHKISDCKVDERCSICSQKHSKQNCPQRNIKHEEKIPKCANCGGPHMSTYKGCSKYQIEKNIQSIKYNKQVSYADAVKINRNEEKEKNGKNENSNKNETQLKTVKISKPNQQY